MFCFVFFFGGGVSVVSFFLDKVRNKSGDTKVNPHTELESFMDKHIYLLGVGNMYTKEHN